MIDVKTERDVIAGVLLSPDPHADIRVIDLPVEAFTAQIHKHTWEVIVELHEDREDVNLATIRHKLCERWPSQYPTDTVGIQNLGVLLGSLMDGYPRHAYLPPAVKRVRELGYRRALATLAGDSRSWAEDGTVGVGEASLRHARRTRELRDTWSREGALGTADAVVDRLARFYSKDADKAVRTGFERLDDALGEVHPGTVMTVLARPAVGKSNLGLNVVANWLDQQADWGMLFCSMEMPETLAASRLIRMVEECGAEELHENLKLKQHPPKFTEQARGRLVISERGGLTMDALDEEFKRAEVSLARPIRAVVLDYLQLMRSNQRLKRYEQLAGLTADLKEFAKRKDIFVVVLSQVGRGESGGAGYKCPSVQSARDSGTVEENADFMVGLWRPDLKPGGVREGLENVINVRVLKGRNGGMNEQVALNFDTESLRMRESFLPLRED